MSSLNSMSGGFSRGKFMNMFKLLAVGLAVVLFCEPAFSQSNSRILGTVTDQSGGVVAGATVFVIDMERGIPRSLTTDAVGEYSAPNLNPSTYMVRVEAKGFKKLERQNIVLEVGKEIRVDVTVQPGEQTQTVTVTEAVPLVETTNATLGGTISNSDVNDMPLNGRLYQNLMSLRPGIVTQPGGSPWTQSTNNSRPDETVWMLDGVVNIDFYAHLALAGHTSPFTDGATIMPIDAIQEFNMEENPKSEYGWMPGAVLNVAVRSGTNNLHGTAYAFGRENSMDARNAFNQGLIAGTCDPNPGFPAACNKLPTQLEQFGGTVGGPIKKDKFFFFAGYEGLRSLVGNTFITNVPASGTTGNPANGMIDAITAIQGQPGFAGLCTSAGQTLCLSPQSLAIFGCTGVGANGLGTPTCTGAGGNGAYGIQHDPTGSNSYESNFPNINTSDNGVGKLEYHANDKNLITSMVFIGHYAGLGEDHPIVNTNWENTAPVQTKTFTEAWIYTPASSVVNDFRFSYNRWSMGIIPGDTNLFANGTTYPINTGVTSTGGFPEIYFKGLGAFGGFLLGSWRGRPVVNAPNPYYDIEDSVSYLRGKHTFKFGAEYAHIEADAFVHDTRGQINFGTSAGVAFPGSTSLEDFFDGDPASASHLVGNPDLRLQMRSTAVFAQDDWRITPKLIVNLGLRYSYVSPFKDASGIIGNFEPQSPTGLVQQGQPGVNTLYSPDRLNFAPHVGFAWDMTGRGTTVLRGGGSIAYGLIQPAAFLQNPTPSADHNHNTSLAADPTGATCAIGPGCPSGTLGGTITTGTVGIASSNLLWNGPADAAGGAGILPATAGVAPSCASVGGVGTCDLFAVDPNLKNPYVMNWSLGITHAFNSNLSLEVGYVGNHGVKLTNIRDINAYEVVNGMTTGIQPYAAQFPGFDVINQVSNDAKSHYNSLQATLTERVTHGLSFTAGYTYGHGLDNGSLSRFGSPPQNQSNPVAGEYASSDLDLRNRFTLSGTYDIPGRKGFGQLLEGWKINSVLTLQGGLPWLVADTGNNFSNDAPNGGVETDRWNFVGDPSNFTSGSSSIPFCGVNPNLPPGTPFNPSTIICSSTSGISGIATLFPSSLGAPCVTDAASAATLAAGGCYVKGNAVMTPPAPNTFGDMGRNIFRDGGFKDWDLSVFKNFSFKERFGAQFRVEVFNVLNHPIISNPYGAANGWSGGNDPSGPPTFGCGCATPDVAAGNPIVGSGSSRVMQLGMKLTF
jgi:hypothetical protein